VTVCARLAHSHMSPGNGGHSITIDRLASSLGRHSFCNDQEGRDPHAIGGGGLVARFRVWRGGGGPSCRSASGATVMKLVAAV
jgi:hypothetical protein